MDKHLAVGIDIGGTNIKLGIIDSNGQILEFTSVPTPQTSMQDLIATLAEFINNKELKYNQELLVGVGIPGVCDKKTREVIIMPNLVEKEYPLRSGIEAALNKKIAMDNDANMAALGEWWKGAGSRYKNILLLTLGTGVGAGIIIDDKLFQGSSGWAGEIGNTVVFPEGEICICGKKGCLEAYGSASAITRRFNAKGFKVSKTEEVFAEAQKGNPMALQVIDEAITALAIGIYNYALIFNPEAVLLGGGMIKAGDQLLKPLREKVTNMLLCYPGHINLAIEPAIMDNQAGVLGSAKAVFDMYI